MAITWNDNLRTGITVIDDQRRLLFMLLKDLDKYKFNKNNFYEVLFELQAYLLVHFCTEEEYMRYLIYPDYKHHKACHDKFLEDFKKILKKTTVVDNITDLGPESVVFIENWIQEHYTNEDLKMANYINERHFDDHRKF